MKAQLILVGGRLMPNILSTLYQQPELIVAICSEQSYELEWPRLKKAIQNITTSCRIEEKIVDGFLLDQIEVACESWLGRSHEEENWVFNVTTATSIMSIGAYNVAKRYAQKVLVHCWYLDTARSRVIALVGDAADKRIFDLKVEQYIAAHDCRLVPGNMEDEREYCQDHWLPLGKLLIEELDRIDLLKKFIPRISNSKPKKGPEPKEMKLSGISEEIYALLIRFSNIGLLHDLRREKGNISFRISSLQANYLEGAWLEAYVWHEARQLGVFSDCLWNQRLIANKMPTDKEDKNQLDVALIYKAQLLIVECKTGVNDEFDAADLYKLDSIANPLGNRSVGKMLVTSSSIPDKSDRNRYKKFTEFKDKAEERGIMLVTRETLPEVGSLLRQMVEEPKFNR